MPTTLKLAIGNFDPTGIAGLQSWHKADAITGKADNDTVAQWDDLSGNARHATEATNPPTYQTAEINGLPVVRFNGTANRLGFSLANNDTSFTLFAVVRNSVITGGQGVLGWGGSSRMLSEGTDGGFYWNTSGGIGANGGAGAGAVIATFKHISAASADVHYNGGAAINIVPNSQWSGGGLATFVIGQTGGGASFWTGDMGELLIYNTDLSDADRMAVRNYLNSKWAVY